MQACLFQVCFLRPSATSKVLTRSNAGAFDGTASQVIIFYPWWIKRRSIASCRRSVQGCSCFLVLVTRKVDIIIFILVRVSACLCTARNGLGACAKVHTSPQDGPLTVLFLQRPVTFDPSHLMDWARALLRILKLRCISAVSLEDSG